MPDNTLQGPGISCVAVIAAGGKGSRFNSDIPKQLVSLAGYPVLHHTLRRFEQAASVDRIVISANRDWRSEITDIAEYALRQTPYQIVDGSTTRNESIQSAVRALDIMHDETIVLVHDGVRPFVDEDLILRVAKALEHFRAVIPIIPSADPLVRITADGVQSFEERTCVVRGQSPQGFILGDLRRAFDSEVAPGAFDTLFELLLAVDPHIAIGHVKGSLNNIKITTPIDRAVAGHIMIEGAV